jgi:3',5'-cyclic AMP phosphodiesterase CpdA
MRLAHISDPHVFDPAQARRHRRRRTIEEAGRTLLKAVRSRRGGLLDPAPKPRPIERVRTALQRYVYGQVGRRFEAQKLADLVSSLRHSGADHIVVTGDLTVVSAPSEYALFREAFRPFHEEGRLTIIPGNHDTHFLDGSISFMEAFKDWIPGGRFPFVRRLGMGAALIGLNSTRDKCDIEDELQFLIVNANGRIGGQQLRELADLLSWAEAERRLPIVLVHHHLLPMSLFTSRHFRDVAGEWTGLLTPLEDALGFIEVLAEQDTPLVVLHGHKHLSFSQPVRIPDQPSVQIMTVASALHGGRYIDVEHRRGGRVSAGYHLYEVSQRGLESVRRVAL